VDLIEAILYGIVQGLTEWLPISSTAHLRILPALLGKPDPGAGFTAVIQLGTVLAVLIFFRTDIAQALSAFFKSLRGEGRDTPEAKLAWGAFYGTLPILIIGFALKDLIKSNQARSLYVIAGTLIFMGVVMLIAEKVGKQNRDKADLQVKDGIIVGCWQALALLPGMSRSGSTISGALFQGLDRTTAARFSFLLSIPSITAAGVYELYSERKEILGPLLMPALVATAVSFVVGYASIALLLKVIQKQGIGIFVGYRILLGIVLLVLLSQGKLVATQPETESGKKVVAARVSP
jgi:undecaprenyl-diphosphatase